MNYNIKKKIKIVLINPPFQLKERYGKRLCRFGANSEPLGLAYLAANLEKYNYRVSIIDSPVLGFDIFEIIRQIKKIKPDLIGFTMLTPMYEIVKELADNIKLELPKCKIIVGGAHATALPKETLEDIKSVDYVCIGEGENTIVDLADCLSNKIHINISRVDGLVYRDENKELIFNKSRQFEEDLDKFPPPARHLLPMKKYKLTVSRVNGADYCPTLILARGCPFDCSFCSHPFGRSFRRHSVERIIKELINLINNYNINQVNFEADTLTIDRDFLLSLCKELIKRGISKKIQWTCESRVDTIDEELLMAMKEAGCWQISYGIESGVQKLLDLINKGVTLARVEEVVSITKKIGITIRGFFILGLPTETIEESWQTIKFAKKLDPLWAQFTIAIPYPGTNLFNRLKEKNQIKHFNWSGYNTWGGWANKKLPFIPQGRDEKEIMKLQKQALVNFYLRPKVFFRFSQFNKFF
ncbi:B12-binding domain-containing radical SAM protein [Patescibacteria group bacterium]